MVGEQLTETYVPEPLHTHLDVCKLLNVLIING